METIIKLKPSELTDLLVQQIRDFTKPDQEAEITITVKTQPGKRAVSGQGYLADLQESINQLNSGKNTVAFTLDGFEAVSKTSARE